MNVKPLSVACPACQKQAIWSADNPSRPFCSERCKLIDLGDWAAERWAIPSESGEKAFTDNESDDYQ
jgi:endogenous inhibitor of DNA gyrase (YacG/DUF329 family)